MTKAVAVVSKSALRPAQVTLYELIVAKLSSGESITLKEAEDIWRTQVCRKLWGGIPHRTDYYAEQVRDEKGEVVGWRSKDVPMNQEEIDFAVMNWLTHNIGLLVIRGYLKVIPMIELQ